MRIVILQDRLRLGGTEVQALSLGLAWRQAGHAVHLVVFRPGGALADSPAARTLAPTVLQKRDWLLDGFAPGLNKTVAALKPDVVVAFGREANVKLAKLRELAPRPRLVGTLRSGRGQPARYWRALQAVDAVVANAHWAGSEAATQGIEPTRTAVIYNGLARSPIVTDATAERTNWRQRAGTPAEAVVFLCVAGFRLGKGQGLLLRAAAQLPRTSSWQLWFAGEGPCLSTCKSLVKELKLQEHVRFAGRVDNPAGLYAAADVAVLASDAEALPNFLIEAQAAGLPVVSTAVGGATECFAEGVTGWAVPAGDPAALAAALLRALQDPSWRAAARAPAMARVQELFDAGRNAAKWIDVLAGPQ